MYSNSQLRTKERLVIYHEIQYSQVIRFCFDSIDLVQNMFQFFIGEYICVRSSEYFPNFSSLFDLFLSAVHQSKKIIGIKLLKILKNAPLHKFLLFL